MLWRNEKLNGKIKRGRGFKPILHGVCHSFSTTWGGKSSCSVSVTIQKIYLEDILTLFPMAYLILRGGVISDPMLLYSICFLVYLGVTCKKSDFGNSKCCVIETSQLAPSKQGNLKNDPHDSLWPPFLP